MFAPVAGAAIGAGLMYVLDPIAGARRRAMVRDQLVSARSRLDDVACATWRDLGNRADGMWAEFLGRFAPEQVGDDVLRERVRAELGTLVRYPGLVEVQADNGLVVLAGAVPADEAQELIRCVRAIRGVTRVENRLDVYRQP